MSVVGRHEQGNETCVTARTTTPSSGIQYNTTCVILSGHYHRLRMQLSKDSRRLADGTTKKHQGYTDLSWQKKQLELCKDASIKWLCKAPEASSNPEQEANMEQEAITAGDRILLEEHLGTDTGRHITRAQLAQDLRAVHTISVPSASQFESISKRLQSRCAIIESLFSWISFKRERGDIDADTAAKSRTVLDHDMEYYNDLQSKWADKRTDAPHEEVQKA